MDTPQRSAHATTGARLRMKVSSASWEWVLASVLYSGLGAPVSVPTTPAEVAAVPRLDLRQLAGVWVGQVEVAPQHRHVQPLLGKDPPGVQRQTFGQGGVVKGDAFYDLGESQMDAGKALRPGLGRPGFHGLPLRGELRVYVMQPDPDLYHIVSS